jgi:hypothetical protein
VPDTANEDTQAAGQPDASTNDDTAAEQALATAMQQPDGEQQPESRDDSKQQPRGQQSGGSKDPWADPEAARREIEKVRKEAASWRTKYREAEPQLTEYQKYLDSQKTELERAQEEAQRSREELAQTRTMNARLMAAATYNLPPDLIDLLGSGSEEEIDARAKLLAERLATATPPPADPESEKRAQPVQTRPVESLTAGGKPADEKPQDMNAILRAMAGRT